MINIFESVKYRSFSKYERYIFEGWVKINMDHLKNGTGGFLS
jgi:hypothetical protein